MDKKDEKEYRFMNEVIKKKPISKLTFVKRFLFVVICAAAAGLVAALVFTKFVPIFGGSFEQSEPVPRVEIDTPDEEAEATSEATPTPVVTPEPAVTGEAEEEQPEDEPSTVIIQNEKSLELSDYTQLYREMAVVAEDAKASLVEVIGITSQMDYLNQTYENQQQVTGLIIAENDTDYFVLTEHKILENVERIQITFCDNSLADAIFIRSDSNTGLSVLKVSKADLTEETLAVVKTADFGHSSFVSQGDPVIAVGSPMGYANSIAYGVVTSVTNTVSSVDAEYNLLTTDILGSTDGSGVLLDLNGKVQGIIAQNFGSSNLNVVTALSVSQLTDIMECLSNNEDRPYLGIKGQDVTAAVSEKTGIPVGLLITSVELDSPAMLSGLKEFDVVVALDDTPITSMADYESALKNIEPGQTIDLTAMRKGTEGYVEVSFDMTAGNT